MKKERSAVQLSIGKANHFYRFQCHQIKMNDFSVILVLAAAVIAVAAAAVTALIKA